MNTIKLSICIPTYNREKFVEKLLTHLKSDVEIPVRYEIVISDNASPDNTQAVVQRFIGQGMPIRYFRRAVNEGGWPNLTNAFLHAKGEYSLYLADDDLLVPEGLVVAMGYLDRHPDVVACYAPWLLHDEVAGRDTGQFYHVPQDAKFSKYDFATLFRFVFKGHVFPEIGIYRTSALRSAYVPREFCFWAFCYLAHFVDIGPVAFLKQPFYRSVTRSKIERLTVQAGFDEVTTAWDRYRGGLEYLLYVATQREWLTLTAEQTLTYEQMCRHFTLNRMAVALRFWMARKEYIKAYELYTRLVLGGFSKHQDVENARKSLPLMVAVQTFARQVNATVGVDRVMLCNVTDAIALGELLREVGLREDIRVIEEAELRGRESCETTVVFTAHAARRAEFIARGYAPNMVFSEDDLTARTIV